MGKMKKEFLFLLNLFTHSRDRAEKESHKTYFAKMNVRIFYNDEFFFSVNDLMHFDALIIYGCANAAFKDRF